MEEEEKKQGEKLYYNILIIVILVMLNIWSLILIIEVDKKLDNIENSLIMVQKDYIDIKEQLDSVESEVDHILDRSLAE